MIAIEQDEAIYLKQILEGYSYVPVAKISYGSYGEIFQIEDQKKKQYVLKIVSKKRMIKDHKLHEAIIESFLLAKLSHPGIVKYYDTIQTNQYIGLILQHCPFGDLNDVMKKVSKNIEFALKKREIALFYLGQILQALSYLHSKSIMHRDLKLQNIVIGKEGNIRLIDFGTSKPLDPSKIYNQQQMDFIQKLRTETGDDDSFTEEDIVLRNKSFVGSAAYLSPESIQMNHSLSTDIWAYGVLAYKIFHGKLPFEGENTYEIFKKIKEFDLKMNEKLDDQIKDLIKTCLNINAESRPTVFDLKKHSYFQNIDFPQVFRMKSPVDPSFHVVSSKRSSIADSTLNQSIKIMLELLLEKKMFFGNFKERKFKVIKKYGKLFISYWYPEGTVAKNQFEVLLGDCAFLISKDTFQIRNKDVKYIFRLIKSNNAEKVVEKINKIIADYFNGLLQ